MLVMDGCGTLAGPAGLEVAGGAGGGGGAPEPAGYVSAGGDGAGEVAELVGYAAGGDVDTGVVFPQPQGLVMDGPESVTAVVTGG